MQRERNVGVGRTESHHGFDIQAAVHGMQGFENRGISGQLRGGAVANFADGEIQTAAPAPFVVFACAFENSTASSTAR